MEEYRLKSAVESLLLVSERPITVKEIEDALDGPRRAEVEAALAGIAAAHDTADSGVRLREVAGGWQLHTPAENAEFVKNLLKMKPQRLSAAAMEVLAIVAYRQPVTRPEIEEIRGVDCGGPLRVLIDRRLVRILGKRNEVGRPFIYGTTKEFLEFFHLPDLSQLPTLKDFEQLSRELGEQVGGEPAGVSEEGQATAPEGAAGTVPAGAAPICGPEPQPALDDGGVEAGAIEGSDELLDELTGAISRLDSTRKNVVKELGLKTAEEEAAGAAPDSENSGETAGEMIADDASSHVSVGTGSPETGDTGPKTEG